ncbi:MAG: DUF6290 family protein [bacterium]|jgi:hypothetical protein
MRENAIKISSERYEVISKIAEAKMLPLSEVVEELLNRALEQEEDSGLLKIVADRKNGNKNTETLTHEEVWK